LELTDTEKEIGGVVGGLLHGVKQRLTTDDGTPLVENTSELLCIKRIQKKGRPLVKSEKETEEIKELLFLVAGSSEGNPRVQLKGGQTRQKIVSSK